MPDRFIPYPSPAPSGGSPSSSQGHPHLIFPEDPLEWGPYTPTDDVFQLDNAGFIPPTDEELALILQSDPQYGNMFGYPLSPSLIAPEQPNGQLNSFRMNSGAYITPQPYDFSSGVTQGGTRDPLELAFSQPPAQVQPRPRPQPQLQRQLQPQPQQPVVPTQTFISHPPPATSHRDQLQRRPHLNDHYQTPPLDRAQGALQTREPERMSLPTAGDLNISLCEVIM